MIVYIDTSTQHVCNLREESAIQYLVPNALIFFCHRPSARQKGPPPPTRTTPVSPPEKPQRANGENPYTVIANRTATTGVAQPTRRTPTTGPPPVSRQGQVRIGERGLSVGMVLRAKKRKPAYVVIANR